jgi:ABC-type multidrug transport system ATPase subunit
VCGLSLAVRPRECFGLLGPNGAGKTSSLRLMQGLLSPSSGAVLVAGRDLAADPAAAQRLVGVCPQHDVLWDRLSGREHLLLYCRWAAQG